MSMQARVAIGGENAGKLGMHVAIAAALVCAMAGPACPGGPIDVSPDGSKLAVANPDSDSVSLVALTDRSAVAEVKVGRQPQTVAFSPGGERLFVTLWSDSGIAAVDVQAGRVTAIAPTSQPPFGVAATPDQKVFVSVPGASHVKVFDAVTLEPLATIDTQRAPRGLLLDASGERLFVTHFFGGQLTVIDTVTHAVVRTVALSPDANVMQGMALDAEAERLYLPHTRSNSASRALVFDATVLPVVAVIDLSTGDELRRDAIALDVADRPVGLPLDAVLVGATLYVANAASNDVSAINIGTGAALAHIEVGDNPRGIAAAPDGSRVFVANSLAGSVSVIDAQRLMVVEEIAVTELPLAPAILNGKRLFNSSNTPALARDQWIACASCHFDGGMDGRTWFFPDGPRNTPALFGAAETVPLHWSGDLDELHDVESTIRTIQAGTGLAAGADNCRPACDRAPANAGRSVALDELSEYLATLEVPQNPNRGARGGLSPAAQRGEGLFMSAETKCAACHVPPLFTDRNRHDVGTGTVFFEAKGTAFDTPSLRGVHASPPYFHDGSAATLRDVLAVPEHGEARHLNDGEIDDLVEYLRAL